MNIRTQVVQTSERTSIVIKIKITQIFREIGIENLNGRAHNSTSYAYSFVNLKRSEVIVSILCIHDNDNEFVNSILDL